MAKKVNHLLAECLNSAYEWNYNMGMEIPRNFNDVGNGLIGNL